MMAEKKKPKDPIGEILGVPSIVENTSLTVFKEPDSQFLDETTKNAAKDYLFARETIYGLIQSGGDLLDDISIIAKQGQQPRAFEVAAQFMKMQLEASRELLNLSKAMQNIEEKEPEHADKAIVKNTTITNNNLHLTTAEMQEMLENKSGKKT